LGLLINLRRSDQALAKIDFTRVFATAGPMNRRAVWVFCLLGLGGFVSCRGAEKSTFAPYPAPLSTLQESKNRLDADSLALESLRNDYETSRIDRHTYDSRYRKLAAAFRHDAKTEERLLLKQSGASEKAEAVYTGKTDAVLRTLGELAYGIPLRVLAGILQGGGNFSP
jgi:hypothetical protein